MEVEEVEEVEGGGRKQGCGQEWPSGWPRESAAGRDAGAGDTEGVEGVEGDAAAPRQALPSSHAAAHPPSPFPPAPLSTPCRSPRPPSANRSDHPTVVPHTPVEADHHANRARDGLLLGVPVTPAGAHSGRTTLVVPDTPAEELDYHGKSIYIYRCSIRAAVPDDTPAVDLRRTVVPDIPLAAGGVVSPRGRCYGGGGVADDTTAVPDNTPLASVRLRLAPALLGTLGTPGTPAGVGAGVPEISPELGCYRGTAGGTDVASPRGGCCVRVDGRDA
eukprot:428929-Pyramimonas_sp.AAC.1